MTLDELEKEIVKMEGQKMTFELDDLPEKGALTAMSVRVARQRKDGLMPSFRRSSTKVHVTIRSK
ncbi:hypothetical protein ACFL1P_01515 [Patescibacteria group bacterium]